MVRTEPYEPITYWEKKRERALEARRLRRILHGSILGLVSVVLIAAVRPWRIFERRPTAYLEVVDMGRDLTDLLAPIRERHDVPALAAVLLDSNDILASGAVGVRRLGSDAPVTTSDQWHIGSCTKAMTATLAARLVDRGVLDWNLSLSEVFTDLEGGLHGRYRDVTLEQLLGHRGGMPLLPEGELWEVLRSWGPEGAVQRQVLASQILSAPPSNWPGSTQYSNTGYAIAAAMMEVVTEREWEDLIEEEVFDPLRMMAADFGAPGDWLDPRALDQPWGHLETPKGYEPIVPSRQADLPMAFVPASGVNVNLVDWARFAQLHLKGAQGRSVFLEPDTFALLHTPWGRQSYALGWSIQHAAWAEGGTLAHAGSNARWYSLAVLVPQHDFAILVATNAGGEDARAATEEVSTELVELLKRRQGELRREAAAQL